MATPGGERDIDPEQRRRLAGVLFNHVWELLGTEDRSTPGAYEAMARSYAIARDRDVLMSDLATLP